jgi:hypothetical protein
MTGDTARNDEQDLFADDFVVEDLLGSNDDLDELFAAPAPAAAGVPDRAAMPAAASTEQVAASAGADDGGAADAVDDVLFREPPTAAAAQTTSTPFGDEAGFAPTAAGEWQGDAFDLDAEARLTAASEARPAAEEALVGETAADVEELPIGDGDTEIELVDPVAPEVAAAAEDGAAGDLLVGDEAEKAASGVVADEQEFVEGIWQAVESPTLAESADQQAVGEAGWEPLPGPSVDALAEVDAVSPKMSDDEAGHEAAAAHDEALLPDNEAHAAAGAAPVGPVVIAAPRRTRSWRAAAALAATLAIAAGSSVVVLRPEWVGMHFEPQRVQQVRIERPQVRVAVATPEAVPLVARAPKSAEPTPTPPPDVTPPRTDTPVAAVRTPEPVPAPPPGDAPPATPVVAAPTPVAIVDAPRRQTPESIWPVATAGGGRADAPPRRLVRVGDNIMLGDAVETPARVAAEGVVAGMRAFAQLRNGNYFIGSVKNVAPETVTLRLQEGEVTIAQAEIARLTHLGSADYEQLQRVTAGSVRLTNNNRLVGSILSQIADDHIVLEFRSNRVMLPRSAIGQVTHGDGEANVRLDVTREEDDWVRQLAEREIGTGTGAAPGASPAPAPAPARSQ